LAIFSGMPRSTTIRTALLGIVFSSVALAARVSGPPEDLSRVLSWLPGNTETLIVSRDPFTLTNNTSRNENNDGLISDKELASAFEHLALGPMGFKDGLLAKRLEGKRINLVIEGSRHFRSPAGLGELPYEGCSVIFFLDNLRDEMTSFSRDARRSALKREQLEAQEVFVFQEKLEEDDWTIFVAFPNEHAILLATDRSYLAEILARMHGKTGPRALPNDLPEWKHVDTEAPFWGLRHYDKSQSRFDPTSPYGGRKSANFPDEQAIGFAFALDRHPLRSVTAIYLSGNLAIGAKPTETLLGMDRYPEAKGLDAKYQELSPGVVQASYSLERHRASGFFLFVLQGILGHAVYL
jgi:hypothetical protein